jgi:predicted nuclease with RNAse H fold
MNWTTIGIDPAPKKPAGVWLNGKASSIQPIALRSFLEDLAKVHGNLLVAWDAPLSFDRGDLCDRRADKVARAWVKRHVSAGHFAPSAIGIRTFSGLSHWTVSCLTLGFPFGERLSGLRLATSDNISDGGLFAIEVHPAVALGLLWLDNEVPEPMPRYKQSPDLCRRICSALDFPPEVAVDDDTLDAFVAERLAEQFISGEAEWLGSPASGGYVVPRTKGARELIGELGRKAT